VWVGVAAARVAHAGVDLAWHAPAGCPDEAAVRTQIVENLDAPADQIDLAAAVDVVATSEGFVAQVTAGDETRELTGTSCSELADAIAVIVARGGGEPRAPLAPPAARPEPRVVAEPPPAPPHNVEWNGGLRVAMLAGNGFSPDTGVGGELGAWASYRAFAAELAAERWRATTADVAMGTGVEVGLTALAARVGWAPVRHVRTWVVGELGSQRGMGIGFFGATGGSGRWVAAGAGGGVHWPIAPHVAAVGSAELEVAFERPRFSIGADATVYEAPRLAERLRFGLELSWF